MPPHLTATAAALVGVHLATRAYVPQGGVLCMLALWALGHDFMTMYMLRNDVAFVAVWAGLAWAQFPFGVILVPVAVRMLPSHMQPVERNAALFVGVLLMPAYAGWQFVIASLVPDIVLIIAKFRPAQPMGSPSFD